MKRYIIPVMFLIISISALFAGGEPEKSFSWSLSLQDMKTGDMIPFSAPVKSSTNEKYRLVIESGSDFFCYVIAEDPEGTELTVLYAGSMKARESWQSPVLEISPPDGTESLFVVASREELQTLAQRIKALDNTSESTQRAVMNEIFRIRSEVSQFREAPEKPVLMGGAARGTPGKSQGVEFSGSGIYLKTISIEH